jgi:hypothetical protein
VRKEPKLLRQILEAIPSVTSLLAEMATQILDFYLAFVRHWSARFRRRFIKPDLGVFSLCEEFDFAQWCRIALKNPIEDPEMRRLLEQDVDWLFDVKCYRC